MKRLVAMALGVATLASFGAVTGKVTEKLGTEWKATSFEGWVTKENALITPESTHLATQYCLRTTQQALDGTAYEKLAKPLLKELNDAFNVRREMNETETGLRTLTLLVSAIDDIVLAKDKTSPKEFEKACDTKVGEFLKANEGPLTVIYQGRLKPEPAPDLPDALKKKLAALAARGVRVAPLTFEGLKEQICKLEGYYSTSWDPRLWKLFSITRSMANVLPSHARDAEFTKALAPYAKLRELVGALDRYSAVAGKPNGLSAGMTETEAKLAKASTPVRMTGVALGTNATALMALYTTAWREKLQDLVLQTDYPEKPFALLTAQQVIEATLDTAVDIQKLEPRTMRYPSQTEVGMDYAWKFIMQYHIGDKSGKAYAHFGDVTKAYGDTAALAWLAINAETNIRQNEKLGGIVAESAPADGKATLNVYALDAAYQGMEFEIDMALRAYRNVPEANDLLKESCLPEVQRFVIAARKASKDKNYKVVQLAATETALFAKSKFKKAFEFKPVLADIGGEVKNDKEGIDGQKDFNLHLATGNWREVPAKVDGKDYLVGTPSAFVLHLPKTTSTRDWQEMVEKYDVK